MLWRLHELNERREETLSRGDFVVSPSHSYNLELSPHSLWIFMISGSAWASAFHDFGSGLPMEMTNLFVWVGLSGFGLEFGLSSSLEKG